MEYSNLFVGLMGMGTVFIGLACIVLLVSAMSARSITPFAKSRPC